MLYHWLYRLHDDYTIFNVFKYITFRTVGALITAMVIYFLLGKKWITFLKKKQFGQIIRDDGPATHKKKNATPTMGGVLMIGCLLLSSLLWCDITNRFVLVSLAVMFCFALIGFADDYIKIIKKDPKGLKGCYKIVIETAVCLTAAVYLYGNGYLSTELNLPFFKQLMPDLGVVYLLLSFLVIVGTANAVNLTDGLDGLVTVPSAFSFFTYAILAYAAGNTIIAHYLQVPSVPGAGEMTIICGATIGALIGFLWYNAHPADIFMGDVGSLGIGSLLGMIALITKNEILLLLIGGIFVMETVSVIVQVVSFKTRGKRVFHMAPLHHHFELMGWQESKVIVRFWIIAFICSLAALVTLKLR